VIKVIYHRDINRVSVEGHAQSGEAGHDLVCASVSTLTYTLASFVQNMKKARQSYNPKTDLKEGDAVISCEPPSRYKGAVTLVFDSICAGFELLAKDYPDNISYEMRGSEAAFR
jgi:uncharacterized protein YsxB (DUF464 family)